MTEDALELRKDFFFARYRLAAVALTPFVALSMFILPSAIANMFLVAVNLLVLRIERKYSYANPITITMIVLGVFLLVAQAVWQDFYDSFFFAQIVFWALFVVAGVLALVGQPFTNFRRTHLGNQTIHWMTSINWIGIYFACGVICIYMPTNLELYFVPPSLVAMGSALTLYIQLVHGARADKAKIGRTNDLARAYGLNMDSVREVYGFFAQNLMESRRRTRDRSHRTVDDLIAYQLDFLTQDHLDALKFFVARDEKGIKGCICAGHDVKGRMTIEELYPDVFDLNRLRSYGKIIEVDYFAIRPDARRSKELPLALLTTVIDYALAAKAKLIIIEALPESEPLYRKLGCEPLFDQPMTSPEGFSMKVMFMNLERLMVQASDEDEIEDYHGATNRSVIERYTKRSAFLSLFARRSMYTLSSDDIRHLAMVEQPVLAAEKSAAPNQRDKSYA